MRRSLKTVALTGALATLAVALFGTSAEACHGKKKCKHGGGKMYVVSSIPPSSAGSGCYSGTEYSGGYGATGYGGGYVDNSGYAGGTTYGGPSYMQQGGGGYGGPGYMQQG